MIAVTCDSCKAPIDAEHSYYHVTVTSMRNGYEDHADFMGLGFNKPLHSDLCRRCYTEATLKKQTQVPA